jgi:hypothetical protein
LQDFSSVAEKTGTYTAMDYADIMEHLVKRWRVAERDDLTGEVSSSKINQLHVFLASSASHLHCLQAVPAKEEVHHQTTSGGNPPQAGQQIMTRVCCKSNTGQFLQLCLACVVHHRGYLSMHVSTALKLGVWRSGSLWLCTTDGDPGGLELTVHRRLQASVAAKAL